MRNNLGFFFTEITFAELQQKSVKPLLLQIDKVLSVCTLSDMQGCGGAHSSVKNTFYKLALNCMAFGNKFQLHYSTFCFPQCCTDTRQI